MRKGALSPAPELTGLVQTEIPAVMLFEEEKRRISASEFEIEKDKLYLRFIDQPEIVCPLSVQLP